jgi:hypothetical protein
MVKLIDLSRVNELLRPVRMNDGGGFQPAPEQIHHWKQVLESWLRLSLRLRLRDLRLILSLSLNLISVGRWSRHPRLLPARLDEMRKRKESLSDKPEGSFSIGLCRAHE